MGDVRAFVLAIGAVLIGLGLLLGWINYKIDKLKEEDKLNIETTRSIIALEKAVKKLNEALKIHEFRLDHQRDERYAIKKRLDILESGHPDTDIDYGTVDDDGNIIEVWFNGKKYVPEDKRSEDTNTFYADNKVVAETTRPESRYTCSDCVRFRRERIDGKWCGICSVDKVIMSNDEQYICDKFRLYKTTGELVCNNYEKAYTATKGEVDYPYIHIPYGNGETDRIAKRIDELQCEIQRLNLMANMGCTAQELRQRWEELMRDDT